MAAATAFGIAGCSAASQPRVLGDLVVVGTETRGFVVVDPNRGGVVARLGPFPAPQRYAATDANADTLYVTVDEDTTPAHDPHFKQLVAIDLRALTVTWRDSLGAFVRRGTIADVTLLPGAIATSGDGAHLVLAGAFQFGAPGLVVVDLSSRAVTQFIGPLYGVAVARVPHQAGWPAGAVAFAGSRDPAAVSGTGFIYLFDAATLALRDSVPLAPMSGDIGYVDQIVAAPTGLIYLTGADFIYAYSLHTHTLVATRRRSSPGTLALSSDAETLYETDPGTADQPGSGSIAVFSASLAPRAPIDLTAAFSVNGFPPRTVGVAASPDGTELYISAGSPVAGGFGAFQPGRLLVLDPTGRTRARSIPLGAEGPGPVFVRRRPTPP